jgi:anti-anti-sigma regulatory factor
MRHVVFVDSAGMGALVVGYHAAEDAGVRFEVQQIAPFVADQLPPTGLDQLLIRR